MLASSLRVFLFGSMFPVICNVLITQWQNLSGCKLSYLCWLQWNCGNLHFRRICHLDSCQIWNPFALTRLGSLRLVGKQKKASFLQGLKFWASHWFVSVGVCCSVRHSNM